jgi:hypothetical protein
MFMGWTSYHRPPGETDLQFISRKLRDDCEIVQSSTVRGVFYAAVREKATDEVWALIVLTERSPKEYYNFACKYISESMGPTVAEAPAKVLDALTETTSEYALEWRALCRERLSAKAEARRRLKTVHIGDTIVLSRPLLFGNQLEAKRFQCWDTGRGGHKWTAITEDGQRFACRLGANWASELQWEVEPAQQAQVTSPPTGSSEQPAGDREERQ